MSKLVNEQIEDAVSTDLNLPIYQNYPFTNSSNRVHSRVYFFLLSAFSAPSALHCYLSNPSRREKKFRMFFLRDLNFPQLLRSARSSSFRKRKDILSVSPCFSVSPCLRGRFDFHFLCLLRSSAFQGFCIWLRPCRAAVKGLFVVPLRCGESGSCRIGLLRVHAQLLYGFLGALGVKLAITRQPGQRGCSD